jgi:predicted glutamine amidotransferase
MLGILPLDGSSVDPRLLRDFRILASTGMVRPNSSSGHRDGWGIAAWSIEGKPFYIGRQPSDASSDPLYESACESLEKLGVRSPLIAHFRKRSVAAKSLENTHPFLYERWAFAHNGTIRNLKLKSSTDSLWFFQGLMCEVESNNSDEGDESILEAFRKHISKVRDSYPYSSITFLLSNGKKIYAYRDFRKEGQYYTMFFTRLSNALVVCQEKIFESNWQELQNGQLLVADNDQRFKVIDFLQPLVQRA